MGILSRIRRAIARVFRPSTPTAPPPEPPTGPPPGEPFDDGDLGATGPVENWFIVATWDGPGTKQRYTGPADLDDLGPGGRVIVAYRDPDTGLVTYRTIHGPFPDDGESFIWDQIRFTTTVVSPP